MFVYKYFLSNFQLSNWLVALTPIPRTVMMIDLFEERVSVSQIISHCFAFGPVGKPNFLN